MHRTAERDLTPYSESQPKLLEVPEPDVDLSAAATELRARAGRKNTTKSYRIAWESFSEFCAQRKARRLPASPQTVAEYLTDLHTVKKRAVKTIRQHKAAIRYYHKLAHHVDPSKDPRVSQVWTGILIAADTGEPKLTYALWRRAVEAVIDRLDADFKALGRFPSPTERLAAVRDRALVLLISSSARLTTGEVYRLRAEEIVPCKDGLELRVQRSPDAIARPRLTTLKYGSRGYCPVQALTEWLHVLELDREDAVGPVFRSIDRHGHVGHDALTPANLLGIVKRRCGLAGIDPKSISMRALRSGSIMQGGYDGEDVREVLDSAGLGEDSEPRVAALVARGRRLKETNVQPPRGLDVLPAAPERTVARTKRF